MKTLSNGLSQVDHRVDVHEVRQRKYWTPYAIRLGTVLRGVTAFEMFPLLNYNHKTSLVLLVLR